jgi:mannonate dehydratase
MNHKPFDGRSAETPRREVLRLALAGAGAPALSLAASPRKDEYDPDNIKIATRLTIRSATDEDLLFLKELGLRWVHAEFGENAPYEYVRSTQERLGRFGIKIYVGVMDAYRSLRIQLGQPGRDQDIERFQTFLRDLGRLGVPVSKIDFHPANTYTTTMVQTPRGYTSREFSVDDFRKSGEKQAFDRQYSAEEIWANYTYFIKAVLPVAEEANVRLALHPDDPPLAMMNGVAKLFIDYDGYRRAEQIAGGSKHWGLMFCVGTWGEGGDRMGKDIFGMIRDFGGRSKIQAVHFRNVSSPLPRFHETFMDDGYLDMYGIVKALRQVRFSGSMVPDHIPALAGDRGINRGGTAYCITYMRSLLRRANEEVG